MIFKQIKTYKMFYLLTLLTVSSLLTGFLFLNMAIASPASWRGLFLNLHIMSYCGYTLFFFNLLIWFYSFILIHVKNKVDFLAYFLIFMNIGVLTLLSIEIFWNIIFNKGYLFLEELPAQKNIVLAVMMATLFLIIIYIVSLRKEPVSEEQNTSQHNNIKDRDHFKACFAILASQINVKRRVFKTLKNNQQKALLEKNIFSIKNRSLDVLVLWFIIVIYFTIIALVLISTYFFKDLNIYIQHLVSLVIVIITLVQFYLIIFSFRTISIWILIGRNNQFILYFLEHFFRMEDYDLFRIKDGALNDDYNNLFYYVDNKTLYVSCKTQANNLFIKQIVEDYLASRKSIKYDYKKLDGLKLMRISQSQILEVILAITREFIAKEVKGE